jgi:glucokinase
MTLTIGVDVGGTKIAAGVVTDRGEIVESLRRNTPARDKVATEGAIVSLVRELSSRYEVAAVGIGAAGYVDAARSTVLFAPNLAWRNEPLRASVEKQVGLPVVIENDANAAAWAEFRFGAGADVNELLMVAVGTGIGGGVVLDGHLFRGSFGIASEFGHIRLVPGGRLCGCGNYGCWEQYASGRALVRQVREVAKAGSPAAARMLGQAGEDPEAITGQVVTEAAKDGDPLAVEAFNEVGRWLGEGLADLVAVFDPAIIVIGGGVSEAAELLLGPARTGLEHELAGRGHRPEPELRPASLANTAGVIGAADLARH